MGRIREYRRLQRKKALRRYEKHRRRNKLAKAGVYEFVIILDNLKQSFNIAKIFRSADAMGAAAVHLIGTDFFDPSPAKGSFKWVPAVFHDDSPPVIKNCMKEAMSYSPWNLKKALLYTRSGFPVRALLFLGMKSLDYLLRKMITLTLSNFLFRNLVRYKA